MFVVDSGVAMTQSFKPNHHFSFAVGSLLATMVFSVLIIVLLTQSVFASDFNRPWRDREKALVLDAYELNSLDWMEIAKNKRIAGFIGKASDGLTAEYCADRRTLCGAKWRKYSVTKELYHTRKMLAKALGIKWGSYHLGRSGNPEMQAFHFIQFADPQPDEVIVLDIESMDTSKFMSLKEAERFARYIEKRLGRYPMLYTNHSTARHIAANRADYPLLSRMKLWYARYKSDIRGTFPMGNWAKPTLWQFAYGGNCSKKSCPYRVKGTPRDIDVNASFLTVAEMKEAWPFDGLVEEQPFPPDENTELLMVSNQVEYPEEEKHSDFVIDIDYVDRKISDVAVGSTLSSTNSTKVKSAIVQAKCDQSVDQMDSDLMDACQ